MTPAATTTPHASDPSARPPRALGQRTARRNAGLAGAAVGVGHLLGPGALSAAAAPAVAAAAPVAPALRPLALSEGNLGDGLYARKRDLILRFGREYDVDRLLGAFKANAGIDPGEYRQPGGWEGLDGEANGNLRGHYAGHFLSMLAQASASGAGADYDEKMQSLVAGLAECRTALNRPDPWTIPTAGPYSGAGAIEVVRGSSVYGELPSGAMPTSAAFTLSVWVRPSRADSWARVLEVGDNTGKFLFLTARNGATGTPRFALKPAGSGERVVSGSSVLPIGEWSHLAVTLTGRTLTLYVDGVSSGVNANCDVSPATLGSMAHTWLGRSHFPDPLFSGGLADLNVYDRALTGSEVAALAAGPAAGSTVGAGTVSSYPLDDEGTATLADASAGGRDGTLHRTWGAPSHPGYLAAYPETQFITLETMTESNYTVVWAPYYTAHKILRGIVDAHDNTSDAATKATAKDLAAGLCDWMYSRLSVLSDATRQRMWNLFSSGEFGGVQEAIVDTYAITGEPRHLELAALFNLDRLIDACVADEDVLDTLHANQHIPIFNGLMRMYEETGEERYLQASRNFWPMVAEARRYNIGGTSRGEFWQGRDQIASTLTIDTNAETCCAHNMLQLSRYLFTHEQDPKYMDYYEGTLINQILGSKSDSYDPDVPLATYFIGLAPGARRDFTPKAGTTCCEGTGLENATKYQDTVYFVAADDSAVYVNLFQAGELDWASRGITLTQTTDFPYSDRTSLRVGGSATFTMRLRRPAWAGVGYAVEVAGRPVTVTAAPGEYVEITRAWSDGDTVAVRMPMRWRTEATPDDPTVRAVFHGPLTMVALDGSTSYLDVSLDARRRLSGDIGDAFVPVPGQPLHFTAAGKTWVPFFEGTEAAFHSYQRHRTPRVVFAGLDSKVPNRRGADGTTFLDAVWADGALATKQAFMARVRTVTADFRRQGRLSAADVQKILLTAGKARMQP